MSMHEPLAYLPTTQKDTQNQWKERKREVTEIVVEGERVVEVRYQPEVNNLHHSTLSQNPNTTYHNFPKEKKSICLWPFQIKDKKNPRIPTTNPD